MSRLIAFNKPYDVLTQFTDSDNRQTLADYINIPNVYPAGRLDKDSEGLLLLTDDGPLQARISSPKFRKWKTYWVQVEGEPDTHALQELTAGVRLKDGKTRPARAKRIEQPENLWPRDPPIRYRASIPTTWLQLSIQEGKNRQVRRMTAAVGYPTLRLIRYAIGGITLDGLAPGEFRRVAIADLEQEPAT